MKSVHALYTKYVPKRNKFGQQGMVARLQVAVLDYDYSVNSQQGTKQAGVLKCVVKPIKKEKTWCFRSELLHGIVDRCANGTQITAPVHSPSVNSPSFYLLHPHTVFFYFSCSFAPQYLYLHIHLLHIYHSTV